LKKKTRTPTTASLVAAAAAKRLADSVQVSIQFAQRPVFPNGMKILLPETIYPNPSAVCFVFPLASRVAV
jgi:hypothetical protein